MNVLTSSDLTPSYESKSSFIYLMYIAVIRAKDELCEYFREFFCIKTLLLHQFTNFNAINIKLTQQQTK